MTEAEKLILRGLLIIFSRLPYPGVYQPSIDQWVAEVTEVLSKDLPIFSRPNK